MEFSPVTIGMLAVAVLLVIFRLSISKQSPSKARDERRRHPDDDAPPAQRR